MSKLPRDISGRQLVKLLEKYGYVIIRETGSHIRLERKSKDKVHKITIPDHNSIKIGTLTNIINDLVEHLNIDKETLKANLFRIS